MRKRRHAPRMANKKTQERWAVGIDEKLAKRLDAYGAQQSPKQNRTQVGIVLLRFALAKVKGLFWDEIFRIGREAESEEVGPT
jgi:hypothetical protein